MRTHSINTTTTGRGPVDASDMRNEMIAVAAYYRAEHRSFCGGDTLGDWVEAEAEIDRMLGFEPRKKFALNSKESLQQRLETQLKELDQRFDELRKKAPQVKGKIHAEFEKQLKALAEKRATAREKLQELRLRTEDAWEDLKEGTEKVLAEMRQTIDRIATRFK